MDNNKIETFRDLLDFLREAKMNIKDDFLDQIMVVQVSSTEYDRLIFHTHDLLGPQFRLKNFR